jgi:hypothetical protein
MKLAIRKNQLHIILDLHDPRLSSSGKTLVVAGTGGPKRTRLRLRGQAVYVGANAYLKPSRIIEVSR